MSEEIRKGFKDKAGNKIRLSANVPNATANDFAGINANGDIVDSGSKASDFAAAEHTHGSIIWSDENGVAGVAAGSTAQTGGAVVFSVKKGALPRYTYIGYDNIENLKRALKDPSTTPEGGTTGEDKLITSRAVYDALLAKIGLEDIGGEEAEFENSDAIDTYLSPGLHNVLYSPESESLPNAYHILLVRNYVYTKTNPATHTTRTDYVVEQTLISNDGIKRRSRAFEDNAHTDPYGDWSEWESLTAPETSTTVVEDDENPVSGGAVYTALAGKSDSSDLADKADKLKKVSIACTSGTWAINDAGTDSDVFATTGIKHVEVSVLKLTGSIQTQDLTSLEDYAVGRVDVSISGTTATAEIRINGYIFTRTGSVAIDNTITWSTLSGPVANTIYSSQS